MSRTQCHDVVSRNQATNAANDNSSWGHVQRGQNLHERDIVIELMKLGGFDVVDSMEKVFVDEL